MKIHDDNKLILTGHRNTTNGLWHNDLTALTIDLAPAIGNPTAANLVTFVHATLFSPALSTLEKALNHGYLTNFPGLTPKTLCKYPPQSIATSKGHQDQMRLNQRSTKPKPTPIPLDQTDTVGILDNLMPPGVDGCSYAIYSAVVEPTGKIYSDQTGRFVSPSSGSNNYTMVIYDYDSNRIFVQPFRKTPKCILEAYNIVHAHLVLIGLRPELQRLDNECSNILKAFLRQENIDFLNAAERAIRTFQNHFIAGLCSIGPNFPIHLWDHTGGDYSQPALWISH
jgi:hypothetical protein